jgi:hypothetical protein
MEQKQTSESPGRGAEPFPFTPVVLRYREDGWTPERQRRYVALLAATGHAGKAARAVGMTGQSAGKLRRRPDAASFARACELAVQSARRRWREVRLAASRPGPPRSFGFSNPLGSRTL